MSTVFESLFELSSWEDFYAWKKEKNHLTGKEDKELSAFIEEKAWLPVLNKFRETGEFALPEVRLIRKTGSAKKRTVYLYPQAENMVLKIMTHLLIRKYDGLFPDNLYSFRINTGVTKALKRLLSVKKLRQLYSYKADISDYFNSIPVENMLPMMAAALRDEPECLQLLSQLISERRYLDRGELKEGEKGVMAGTPFAVFLANLYLVSLDLEMQEKGLLYARYSDDIIVFCPTEQERDQAAGLIETRLNEAGLKVNEKKRFLTSPGEPWSFLGIKYDDGTVDISIISRDKLKAKIRRKARALQRWRLKKGASPEQAAKGLIRAMNRKFFDADSSHELTWTRWYFPLISTDKTLKEIDSYLQYWIRALYSGHHREKNYDLRYETMKDWGYVSLVHAWYDYRENKSAAPNGPPQR